MRKKKKLTEEDILKNSGKKITGSISIIKKHEKLYTIILVIAFIFVVPLSIFLGLRVGNYELYDKSYENFGSFSFNSKLVFLSNNDIMDDEEGLKSNPIYLGYINNSGKTINFIVRFVSDDDSFEKCECQNKKVDYTKIKYSLDGKNIFSFTNSDMVVTTGMIKHRSNDNLNIRLWLDSELNKDEECFYYGRFVFEELEDMDEEDE